MRGHWLTKGLALTTVAAGVFLSGACAEPEGMFYVSGLILANNGVFSGDDCKGDGVKSPDITVQALLEGDRTTVRWSVTTGAACLMNKLHSNRANGVETSNILVNEYDVSLGDGSRTLASSAAVPADGSDGSIGLDGGISPLVLDLIGPELATSLRASNTQALSGSLIVRGRTTGGIDLETPEFFFPVLINYMACSCPAMPEDADPDFDCDVVRDPGSCPP